MKNMLYGALLAFALFCGAWHLAHAAARVAP